MHDLVLSVFKHAHCKSQFRILGHVQNPEGKEAAQSSVLIGKSNVTSARVGARVLNVVRCVRGLRLGKTGTGLYY